MENVSNRNGRALEYRIVEELTNKMPIGTMSLTQRAQQDQVRDRANYLKLMDTLKNSYSMCASIVFYWLDNEFSIVNNPIEVDRLSDQDARGGDVTDIRILTSAGAINLSIKHNHAALKHQRPPSTAQWCGYPKGSKNDLLFRQYYEKTLNTFLSEASMYFPEAKNFRDIKEKNDTFINEHLYSPVCE